MGAGGLRHAGRALHRPHGRDLRPARSGAQRQGRSCRPCDAGAPRRRRPSRHRGGRTGGPSTSSGAAAAPSTRWRSSRRTRRMCARSWPTSRRWPRSSPTGSTRSAACRAIHETYQQRGWGAGMAHFIAVVSHQGPFTAEIAAQPGPDPAMFGMPAEDDGTRTDPMLGQGIITTTHLRAGLRGAARGVRPGSSSRPARSRRAEMASRGAMAVAERLGTQAVSLPERPRRLPGRRVRPDRRAGRVRRQARARSSTSA